MISFVSMYQYIYWFNSFFSYKTKVLVDFNCYTCFWKALNSVSINSWILQEDVCDLMQPYVKLPCFFDPSSDPSHANATTIHVKCAIQTAVRYRTADKQTNGWTRRTNKTTCLSFGEKWFFTIFFHEQQFDFLMFYFSMSNSLIFLCVTLA